MTGEVFGDRDFCALSNRTHGVRASSSSRRVVAFCERRICLESDGFRSGDTVERVEKELTTWGVFSPRHIPIAGQKDVYTVGAVGRWFTFCQGRLFDYDRPFEVDLSGFSTMLQGEIERRGSPTLRTGPVTVKARGVWFVWHLENEIFQLILAQDEYRKLEATKRYTDVTEKRKCPEG